MAIADWSPTAANNATTLGVNIGEGCPPSNVNDAIRKLMADVATGVNFSILGSFLSSTSLATARTALGVNSSSTTVTALDALTPAANKLPYFTGASTAALTDITSFARTVLDDGDAATARDTLSALGVAASSLASPGYISIDIPGSSSNLKLQWGTVTVGANSDGTITYPSAFSSFAVCVCVGGPAGGGDAGSIHTRGASGTSSQAVSNTSGGSLTGSWIAIGV